MRLFISRNKDFLVTIFSLTGFCLLWKGASAWMGSPVILPSPEETAMEAARLMRGAEFWLSLGATLSRGLIGFAFSLGAGLVVGFFSGRYPLFRSFAKPYLTAVHSTPVLAVILLALIWFRTEIVPVFVAFLMAFPAVTASAAEGVRSVDPKLLDMARVYRVSRRKLLTGLYLPSALPFIAAGASSALGLSWRVVVAAEVLSQPFRGIGTGLQEAKVRLETPRVFAWTLAALAISWVMDSVFSRGVKALKRRTQT